MEIAAMIHDRGGLLLALLSGGGSAMLAKPTRGITLEDKQSAIDILSRSGVPIAGINCVRKHLSAIKGGRLAAAAGHCLTLAISDVHVPPDDPSTIASGPTVGDPSTFQEALQVIDAAAARVPVAVRDLLERGAAGRIDETPKPGDASLRGTAFKVIANRQSAMAGAMRLAEQRRYDVHVIEAAVTGEAAVAGMAFVRAALAMFAAEAPACAIASGETTVKVRGAGRGGRNQEFVIGAAMELNRMRIPAVVCSAGTDGIDGADGCRRRCRELRHDWRGARQGVDLDHALALNDAYAALDALGALVKWGPTQTNVGDVHVLLKP